MVRCHLINKLYVRKSAEKRVVVRNRDVRLASKLATSPKSDHETSNSNATHSMNGTCCALRRSMTPDGHHIFQTPTALYYVMDFATGGSMADLLESSGQIPEADNKWRLPQMVSAIDWCHAQGLCHRYGSTCTSVTPLPMYICFRDINPSNFILVPSPSALIDLGSSVRLLPARSNGVQLVPKASCLVLCGTCDYISPEILRMQEDAWSPSMLPK